MTPVSIVILNYNGENLLPQFLPSVVQHSAEAEIIIADNASTDRSREVIRKNFPSVRIIALEKNFGFCGGYNRALTQVSGKYVVLLNSDVEVTAHWLTPLYAVLDAYDDVAVVQPKILSYRHRDEFEYAGAGGGLIDALGYPFCRGRVLHQVEKDLGQYDDEREVFWASGACCMMRRETFLDMGGFDEDFFAHMEEIDLCWKIIRSSGKVFYSGKSCVYHLGAATLAYDNPEKTYLNFRNGLALIFKHLDTIELTYKLPFRILLDWAAAFLFLIQGKPKSSISVLRAHWDFIARMGSNRRKRKHVHTLGRTYPRSNIYGGLIAMDFYTGRRKSIR